MVFGFGSSSKTKAAAAEAAAAAASDDSAVSKKGSPAAVVLQPLPPGFQSTPGATVLVTGSSGFCGARLAELLMERGAKQIILFDICRPSDELKQRFRAKEMEFPGSSFVHCNGREDGDLTSVAAVETAFQSASKQIDVVYHIAALVGPFHETTMYYKVNVEGTRNILNACLKFNVPKLVNSSSPSTRFDGNDIEGAREDELTFPPDGQYTALYAETKAEAERLVTDACCDQLRTTSVSPHQVYGPHDTLFLPSLLSTMGNGRLRIFGKGDKMISVCYVDNYCHGLMCGADAISKPNSPALGKFYIITDTTHVILWDILNDAGMEMGFRDLTRKFHLPVALLYFLAYLCQIFTLLTGTKTKLTPFTVRMMTIHRYFSPILAKQDLDYEPIYKFEESWKMTTAWFKANWLPQFCQENGLDMPTDKTKSD